MFSVFDSILSGLTHILIEIFSDLPWMWASVKFSWNSSPHSLRKTLSPQIQNPRRQKTIVVVFKLIIQNKHLTSWIVQLGVIPWSHDDSKQTMTIMTIIIISSHSEHVSLTFFAIVSGAVLSALICITRSHHPQNLSKQPAIHQVLQNTPYWQKQFSYWINNIVSQILPHFCSLPDFHFPRTLPFFTVMHDKYVIRMFLIYSASIYTSRGKQR